MAVVAVVAVVPVVGVVAGVAVVLSGSSTDIAISLSAALVICVAA